MRTNYIFIHQPSLGGHGAILNLLELATACFSPHWADPLISLNLRDYDVKYKWSQMCLKDLTTTKIKTLSICDILCYCPISQKSLVNNCLVTNNGIFVHRSFENFVQNGFCCGHVTKFKFTTTKISRPINNNSLLSKFTSDLDHQKMIVTCDHFCFGELSFDNLHSKMESLNLAIVRWERIGFWVFEIYDTQLPMRSSVEAVYTFYLTNKHKIPAAHLKRLQTILSDIEIGFNANVAYRVGRDVGLGWVSVLVKIKFLMAKGNMAC